MKKYILITILLFSQFSGVVFADECIEGNCINGQGTYTWADGARYKGEFKDGKRTDHGTYTFADGGQYVGEWKDNKQNGRGTHTYADGTTQTGCWIGNKFIREMIDVEKGYPSEC